MKDPIISVSGLRGIIGESLSPELAMRFACAFAGGLPPGPIVVSRDGRATGHMLLLAIQSGLSAIGRPVIDGGIAATPTAGVLVRQYQAAGGVQISASHNPPEYNGLKLFSDEGQVLSAERGERVVHDFRQGTVDWVSHSLLGGLEACQEPTQRHLELVLEIVDVPRIRDRRFRVLLDSNHGAGSLLGRRLLEELNCDAVFLGGDPDGLFDHPPEPTAEHLADVRGQVSDRKMDVGFCQDPDADRLAVIDEDGRYIGEEYTLALCLDHLLRARQGTVVVNCATSRMAEDLARLHGCRLLRGAVGEAHVVQKMKAEQAVFGGEGNGGPIDPRVGYVRDSFVGMALILDFMASSNEKISHLADRLPRYEIVKTKLDLDREGVGRALETLVARFRDATPSRLDGLRLDWPDQWLLIRPSNTEPIVRIIAEAPTKDAAIDLCERTASIVRAT